MFFAASAFYILELAWLVFAEAAGKDKTIHAKRTEYWVVSI